MLERVRIKNFTIIDDLEVEFSKGLNILTGETGAGKSIIIDAIEIALGAKFDSSLIRKGEDQGFIELEFIDYPKEVSLILKDLMIEEDDSLIIRRVFEREGRTKFFINSQKVSSTIIKSLKDYLIDIVSQHYTIKLFNKDFQLIIFDLIAGLEDLKKEVSEIYLKLEKKKREYQKLLENIKDIEAKKEFYEFQLKEFEEISIDDINEEEFYRELNFYKNYQKNIDIIVQIKSLIENEEFSLSSHLSNLSKNISKLSIEKKDYYLEKIDEFIDIISELEKELDIDLDISPEEVEERFNNLQKIAIKLEDLKVKYEKDNVEELKELKKDIEEKLNSIGSFEIDKKRIEEELEKIEKEYIEKATLLSKKRKEKSKEIEKTITKSLRELSMPYAEIVFKIEERGSFSKDGIDELEILIKTNKGEDFKPLSKIASGGELSRVMLVLKEFYIKKLNIPTVVFDEIDTGIGGETASKVGEHLRNLGNFSQVFVITHFSQIAVKGDIHFKVEKVEDKEKVATFIKQLDKKDRIVELARMMGDSKNKDFIETAKSLLEKEKSYEKI